MTITEILVLVCSFFGAAAVMLIAFWYFLRRRCKLQSLEQDNRTCYSASKEFVFEDPSCKEMSIKDIYAATNNLSPLNFIGQGIAGKVYKGVLATGCHVAVKHIIKDEHAETFMREVTSLSHVRHPNLVTLRGYCEYADECFLVYELCVNGNLSEWLFGEEKTLSWIQRLQIALGSACGLWFLHIYPGGCIVHRDIKPTNILLGANFEAKLSDFGLSKCMDYGVSHVSSEVRGTFGYVDPEYRQNHHVNAAGDVYSFGIVLLQILSGKRVINLNVRKPMSLDKMAKLLTRGGNISEFADPKLNGEYSTEAFDLTLKLALSCTDHKQQRPSMEQVVSRLEKALEISLRFDESSNVSTVGSESQTTSF
ncbi:probable receptor-like protein kinase At2g42960 isoform X2 [Typha angustifolia]|uniref:probable receptor-like protein kinase At2g42960 isoform X2 n=1 Tax=Typha angustifolia TaxID=59011 RepID=UPI003C2AC6CA